MKLHRFLPILIVTFLLHAGAHGQKELVVMDKPIKIAPGKVGLVHVVFGQESSTVQGFIEVEDDKDIVVMVLNIGNYNNFRAGREYTPTYDSGKIKKADLKIPIPGGFSYIVISNRHDTSRSKNVTGRIVFKPFPQ